MRAHTMVMSQDPPTSAMRLEFSEFSLSPRGTIYALLTESYASYFEEDPGCEAPWKDSWRSYDAAVYGRPDTIGACGFVSLIEGERVGFASWDPGGFPEHGTIGHNCVLPSFRGRTFGRQQIEEILRIFSGRGVRGAVVTTGEHPFFHPARRMYRSLGFRETARRHGDPHSRFRTIDYELRLRPARRQQG